MSDLAQPISVEQSNLDLRYRPCYQTRPMASQPPVALHDPPAIRGKDVVY
jgi:hypothetical protein